MDIEEFKQKFSNNLKKNILKNFKTRKEFAEFLNIHPTNLNNWVKCKALPDLHTIYEICNTLGITIDYLIKGEPSNLTSDSIDYNIFNEIVTLVNDFAKTIKLKEIKGKHYLAVYKNVQNIKRLNKKIIMGHCFFS